MLEIYRADKYEITVRRALEGVLSYFNIEIKDVDLEVDFLDVDVLDGLLQQILLLHEFFHSPVFSSRIEYAIKSRLLKSQSITAVDFFRSKRKFIIGRLLLPDRRFGADIFLRLFMNRICVNDNGAGRGWAGQLTRAAADAVLPVDFRIENIFLVRETNRVRGADFAAGAAIIMIDIDNANIFQKLGFADLRELFLLQRKRRERAGRADPAAEAAFIITKAFFIIHFRLHQTGCAEIHKSRRQNLRRADADAQRTGGARPGEMCNIA